MSILKLSALAVILLFAAACTTTGARIENEAEGVGFAYIKVIEVAKQVEQQRLSGGITDVQAMTIRSKLKSAINAVRVGQTLLCISSTSLNCVVDEAGANRQANIAIAITQSIRGALE